VAKIQKNRNNNPFNSIFFIFHPKIVHQAATKLSSHRSHRTHRSFWRKVFSHRLHGYTQIRRVWHPCHTHAATKLSSHKIRGTQKRQAEKKNLCTSVKSVGGYSPPEASVYSVKSVGEYPPPEISVNSVNSVGEYPPPEASVNSVNSVGEYPPPEASVNSVQSVGGLAQTNLEWVLWKEFGGWRGYGRDAIPSYENSHGLHGYAQIRRVWHPCHTHAATKLSSHRIHGTHRNDWRRRKICVHL